MWQIAPPNATAFLASFVGGSSSLRVPQNFADFSLKHSPCTASSCHFPCVIVLTRASEAIYALRELDCPGSNLSPVVS